MKKVTNPAKHRRFWLTVGIGLAIIGLIMLTTMVLLYVATRVPPNQRTYETQAHCEKKSKQPCHLEICNSTVTTRTMSKTCAKDSKRGWVSDL